MAPLTLEQQRALDELVRQVHGPQPAPAPSALETWLGLSRGDLAGMLGGLLERKDQLQERFRAWVEGQPIDSAFEFLAAASFAFYAAEREVNPKINTYVDAFYYLATCASVGEADMFPITQTGRAIASLVMIAGPALTSHLLERPGAKSSILKAVV